MEEGHEDEYVYDVYTVEEEGDEEEEGAGSGSRGDFASAPVIQARASPTSATPRPSKALLNVTTHHFLADCCCCYAAQASRQRQHQPPINSPFDDARSNRHQITPVPLLSYPQQVTEIDDDEGGWFVVEEPGADARDGSDEDLDAKEQCAAPPARLLHPLEEVVVAWRLFAPVLIPCRILLCPGVSVCPQGLSGRRERR